MIRNTHTLLIEITGVYDGLHTYRLGWRIGLAEKASWVQEIDRVACGCHEVNESHEKAPI